MGFGVGSFGPSKRRHVHRPSYRFVAADEQCDYSGYSYDEALESFIDDLDAKNTQQKAENNPERFYGIMLGTGNVTAYDVAKWSKKRALPLAPVEEEHEIEERETD
ncbi:MAG: hypothetical protein SVU32_08925, partial [Candidatus Nanohaloarchaea archaeon]|nr:hypothetical protein [Candidatus Nanohaloarchaea archaeon]